MARNSTKMTMEVSQDKDGVKVALHFSNGEEREVFVSQEHSLYDRFAAHGVEQKFRDRIASAKTAEDAVKAIDDLTAALEKGHWTVRGNGEPQETAGLLVRALAKKYGKAIAEVQKVVERFDKAKQAALRADPEIAAIIDELRPKGEPKKADDVKAALEAGLGL